MPDFLFPEPVLSPLASAIQDHVLYRRRNGLALIQNEELCAMMRNKLQSKVDDRAVRAAVDELQRAHVKLINLGTGYEITDDLEKIAAYRALMRSHGLAFLQKGARLATQAELDNNYDLHGELEMAIQESLASTAEGLK